MAKFGFLIDYDLCTGCQACVIACRQEHNRPEGEYGIVVREVEAEENVGKPVYFPFFTKKCNTCVKRTKKGLPTACEQTCWAQVIQFGKMEELAEEIKDRHRCVLWAPH